MTKADAVKNGLETIEAINKMLKQLKKDICSENDGIAAGALITLKALEFFICEEVGLANWCANLRMEIRQTLENCKHLH